ncbi:hypothetical protein IMPERIA89_500052 [Imperialibacter sp. 89]|nr:hypothetical protein IMPERIA89_500052 [Imperialibacter sp. 89]
MVKEDELAKVYEAIEEFLLQTDPA